MMNELLARLRAAHQALTPLAMEFHPPDELPNYTPYACSYHWFRGPDGRAISLDVIRSDDTGCLGLRVVRERAGGGVDGLAYITPKQEWLAMRNDGTLGPEGTSTQPLLSRSQHAIAGRVFGKPDAGTGALRRVRFELSLHPESPGYGTGQLGLGVMHLVGTDYLDVRYRGFVEIDGERLEIDSHGSISLHAGDKLSNYAYLITVPSLDGRERPKLLAAALSGALLRRGGELLGDRDIVYAYGQHGMPPVSLHIGEFDRDFPLGLGGRIVLSDIHPFFHDFLGEPTCTAAAHAQYVPMQGPSVDLGRIFLDYRGRHFLGFLNLSDVPGA